MNYILLFTITPVQSFIAQTRKTSDLFHGSRILSDLINYALDDIKINTSEIIFPYLDPDAHSAPNRFIVEIVQPDKEAVQRLAYKIKTKITAELKEMTYCAIKKAVISEAVFSGIKENFDAQIAAFLNIQWAAVPVHGDYQTAYQRLSQLMGAVKNTRTFSQLSEKGRKCSLCGERNLLFYSCKRSSNPQYDDKAIPVREIAAKEEKIAEKEGLCAVCFTKRFYSDSDKSDKNSFPSTAKVAVMDWLANEKITSEEHDKFKTCFKKFDDEFYYRENLTRTYLEKKDSFKGEAELNSAQEIIKRWYEYNEKKDPSKYYALVMFDGDSMGQWLSGEFLKVDQNLKEFHKVLSRAFSDFAKEAKVVLTEPKGRTVYAGGDDFLGLVNLQYLFSVLEQWKQLFDTQVNESIKNFKKEERILTFSAGVVIAHYKTPLQEVLKTARRMEKAAKGLKDKNGLGFAFITKSNNVYECCFKADKLPLLKELVQALKAEGKERLSSSFIFNFSRTFSFFDTEYRANTFETTAALMLTELKRLMQRASEKPKPREKWVHEELFAILKDFFYSLNTYRAGTDSFDLSAFITFLELADKLAREINDVY